MTWSHIPKDFKDFGDRAQKDYQDFSDLRGNFGDI